MTNKIYYEHMEEAIERNRPNISIAYLWYKLLWSIQEGWTLIL